MDRSVPFVLVKDGNYLASFYISRRDFKPCILAVSLVADSFRMTLQQAHSLHALLIASRCEGWTVIEKPK